MIQRHRERERKQSGMKAEDERGGRHVEIKPGMTRAQKNEEETEMR